MFINLGMLWCTKSRDETLLAQVLSDPHSPAEFRLF
jgi:predicted metalloendopeptidase